MHGFERRRDRRLTEVVAVHSLCDLIVNVPCDAQNWCALENHEGDGPPRSDDRCCPASIAEPPNPQAFSVDMRVFPECVVYRFHVACALHWTVELPVARGLPRSALIVTDDVDAVEHVMNPISRVSASLPWIRITVARLRVPA